MAPRSCRRGVSAITVAELQHGVRRADTSVRRSTRTQFLDEVLLVFPTYPLTAPIAQRLGDLDADLQLAGQRRDLPDLIIAATALELDFAVATRNRKHFENIPGLRLAESN